MGGRPALAALWRWAPAAAYAALITYLSHQPGLQLPSAVPDKAAHAVEFGALAALLWRAGAGAFLAPPSPGRAAAALLGCVLFSFADEVHQSFVPGRDASGWDVAADAGGAAVSLAILWLLGARAGPGRRAGRGRAAGAASGGNGARPHLTLLSRADCSLCEEAERVIKDVQSEIPFTYEKVDVDSDADLSRRYGMQIPVVLMQGRKLFKHRVDPERLRRRIARAQGGAA